ncbi:hypothetical protein [Aeromonas phage 85AhydR10PP]|nr:hypothetical protein [Aeromonas phage 85AhydR10PP]
MINMEAITALLTAQGITPRILREWDETPQACHGEQTLAIDTDEVGEPVAIFIPREV